MTNAAILGCGYVGTAVARCWTNQGIHLTATTTSPDRVTDLQGIADAVKVVHGSDLAAVTDLLHNQDVLLVAVAGGRRAGYEAVYLNTAKTVLTALDHAPKLRQIIYTSSFSVYGDHGGQWVTEADPVQPTTDNTKIMAETEQLLLSAATPNRRVCVLRLGGIYGPNRELQKIYSRAAGTTRPGAGTEGSNWVHLDDIVGAIDFARQQSLNGIYNVVQDEIPTSKELIERVCRVHNLPQVSWDPSRPSERPHNVRVSNQKLKAAGYPFIHSSFDHVLGRS
jgi:nucleoside-diphosphate-sugar epimerase